MACFIDNLLHEGVERGAVGRVRETISEGADVNSVAYYRYGAGADVNSRTGAAARQGDAKTLTDSMKKCELSEGADVNTGTRGFGETWTPLAWASSHGWTELMNILLDAGADVNKGSGEDFPRPVLLAMENGHGEAVRLLMLAGADVNRKMLGFEAAAKRAQKRGHTECVRLVCGLEPLIKPVWTPLLPMLLGGGGPGRMAPEWQAGFEDRLYGRGRGRWFGGGTWEVQRFPIARQITERRFLALDPRRQRHLLSKALITALLQEDREFVQQLLDAGANVNHQSYRGNSLISICLKRQTIGCLDLLLKAGADVNIPDREGMTPLMLAPVHENGEYLKAFLRAGADVKAADKLRFTALMWRLGFTKREQWSHLFSQHIPHLAHTEDVPRRTHLLYKIAESTLAEVKILLRAGSPVRRVDQEGQTALTIYLSTVSPFCMQVAQLLILAGERVDRVVLRVQNGRRIPLQIHPELQKLQDEIDGTELNLQSQCRRVIRRHLLSVADTNLFHQVERLPLPQSIKSFLVFDASLDDK